jgi:hypothetical protein
LFPKAYGSEMTRQVWPGIQGVKWNFDTVYEQEEEGRIETNDIKV